MSPTYLTDPTSPPGDPEILDYDKDYAEIGFAPPENENGAPVQGYVVEYREKGTKDWKKVCSFYRSGEEVEDFFNHWRAMLWGTRRREVSHWRAMLCTEGKLITGGLCCVQKGS